MSSWLWLRCLRTFFTRCPRFRKNLALSTTQCLVTQHAQNHHEQISVDCGIMMIWTVLFSSAWGHRSGRCSDSLHDAVR